MLSLSPSFFSLFSFFLFLFLFLCFSLSLSFSFSLFPCCVCFFCFWFLFSFFFVRFLFIRCLPEHLVLVLYKQQCNHDTLKYTHLHISLLQPILYFESLFEEKKIKKSWPSFLPLTSIFFILLFVFFLALPFHSPDPTFVFLI